MFWEPVSGAGSKPVPCLNQFGNIIQFTWNDLPNHINGIVLDEFIVMPDHVHGIIRITDRGMARAGAVKKGTGLEPALAETFPAPVALPEIIRQFKTFSAKRINIVRESPGSPVWQRNYHDHIVRNENSLCLIRKYIRENPLHLGKDHENHFEHKITEFDTGNLEN